MHFYLLLKKTSLHSALASALVVVSFFSRFVMCIEGRKKALAKKTAAKVSVCSVFLLMPLSLLCGEFFSPFFFLPSSRSPISMLRCWNSSFFHHSCFGVFSWPALGFAVAVDQERLWSGEKKLTPGSLCFFYIFFRDFIFKTKLLPFRSVVRSVSL